MLPHRFLNHLRDLWWWYAVASLWLAGLIFLGAGCSTMPKDGQPILMPMPEVHYSDDSVTQPGPTLIP